MSSKRTADRLALRQARGKAGRTPGRVRASRRADRAVDGERLRDHARRVADRGRQQHGGARLGHLAERADVLLRHAQRRGVRAAAVRHRRRDHCQALGRRVRAPLDRLRLACGRAACASGEPPAQRSEGGQSYGTGRACGAVDGVLARALRRQDHLHLAPLRHVDLALPLALGLQDLRPTQRAQWRRAATGRGGASVPGRAWARLRRSASACSSMAARTPAGAASGHCVSVQPISTRSSDRGMRRAVRRARTCDVANLIPHALQAPCVGGLPARRSTRHAPAPQPPRPCAGAGRRRALDGLYDAVVERVALLERLVQRDLAWPRARAP